ncbi:MAG: precorrin-6Y C5,15-methyltransferase (decarboxylating) subunit CbiT, partial [Clostridium sp.]|nr:precorrin-6Y C5,15-methyltransferase (decarboxylating) subunit CbiT [Clostridium sp.]
IKGDALSVKNTISESFDGIFIGGSSGDIEEIIEEYAKKLKEHGTMVMNFITVDNLYKASEKLRELNFKTECCQVQISRQRGKTYMFLANNPVYILSAKR